MKDLKSTVFNLCQCWVHMHGWDQCSIAELRGLDLLHFLEAKFVNYNIGVGSFVNYDFSLPLLFMLPLINKKYDEIFAANTMQDLSLTHVKPRTHYKVFRSKSLIEVSETDVKTEFHVLSLPHQLNTANILECLEEVSISYAILII